MKVEAETIDTYQGGYRHLMRVTAPGSYAVLQKDGSTAQIPYQAGSVLVADDFNHVLAGPVSREGAADLADRILDGDARALTAPDTLLVLAAAIAGFGLSGGAPDAVERCIACDLPLTAGDMVLDDASGGAIHVACCGPERESYVGADGEPLKDGEPIPTGHLWQAGAAEVAS